MGMCTNTHTHKYINRSTDMYHHTHIYHYIYTHTSTGMCTHTQAQTYTRKQRASQSPQSSHLQGLVSSTTGTRIPVP